MLVVVAVVLALLVAAATTWTHRAHRRRPLPHRPAHGTPPPAGPRHRAEHADTGSISATDIRRALDDAARSQPKETRRP